MSVSLIFMVTICTYNVKNDTKMINTMSKNNIRSYQLPEASFTSVNNGTIGYNIYYYIITISSLMITDCNKNMISRNVNTITCKKKTYSRNL